MKSFWTSSKFPTKAVRVTTTPVLKNLGESKLVLAALQKFGEVVTYRNLKYDLTTPKISPNNILAIFDSEQAAENAINASPITIPIPEEIRRRPRQEMSPRPPLPTSSISDRLNMNLNMKNSRLHPDINTPHRDTYNNNDDDIYIDDYTENDDDIENAVDNDSGNGNENTNPNNPTERPAFITCRINPSRYNHSTAQGKNPYYSTFYLVRNSYPYRDLRDTGIPLRELADPLVGKKGQIPMSVKKKVQEENVRLGATSLLKLYEEGLLRLKS